MINYFINFIILSECRQSLRFCRYFCALFTWEVDCTCMQYTRPKGKSGWIAYFFNLRLNLPYKICLVQFSRSNLFNREIIGVSTERHKSVELVIRTLSSIKGNLHCVSMFHTDSGKEFDNVWTTFGIQRSLSIQGFPYDNAISESTFKALKTEFIYPNHFRTLDELNLQLSDYINWFNNHRIYCSFNYQTPVSYKLSTT